MNKHLMLLNGGKFDIERNCNGEAATTNGFLLRRCRIYPTTPGGYIVAPGCCNRTCFGGHG
ncbi:hypothetical protein [Mycetohabitans sp. B46]|uniref:hypothetical protein n=1 Tax=Mycetohabitans sp. B46 TaxID=2772536 RepID=UPI00307D8856